MMMPESTMWCSLLGEGESELMRVNGDMDAILKDSKEEFKIVEISLLVKIISNS